VSVGARLHLPVLGYALAGALLIGAMYWQWRYKPSLLESTGIAITAAVLLGPVSWAGYTLFLIPLLFSLTWDKGVWAVILLLDAPFAPAKLATAVGIHVFDVTSTREANLLIHAIIGSVYVWAALLLMHRLIVQRGGLVAMWPWQLSWAVRPHRALEASAEPEPAGGGS
jgi:hypothetical protein